MAEEIQFFGMNSNSKLSSFKVKETLQRFGIYYPASFAMSIDEVKSSDPKAFPWPIAINLSEDFSESSKVVHSWSGLQDILDGFRNPNSLISLRMLPQAESSQQFNNIFAYLGKDFICLHDVNSDVGITFHVDNDHVYDGLSEDFIFRLVFGSRGWFFDASFDYNDSRLSPITHLKLKDVESNISEFQNGYKAGFTSPNNISFHARAVYKLDSYVGDFYSFGYYFGCQVKKEILNNTENASLKEVCSSTILMIKLLCGESKFKNVMGLSKIHNKILAGDTFCLADDIVKVIDTLNTNSISNIPETLKSIGKLVSEISESKGSNPQCDPISIPEENSISTVANNLKSEISQYRILSKSSDSVNVRLQIHNAELVSKITSGSETYSVMIWKDLGNTEADIEVKSKYLNLEDDSEGWNNWITRVEGAEFKNKSTYSGSGQKYASLIFKEEGFCLDDGTLVIPKVRFLKYLQKSLKAKIVF